MKNESLILILVIIILFIIIFFLRYREGLLPQPTPSASQPEKPVIQAPLQPAQQPTPSASQPAKPVIQAPSQPASQPVIQPAPTPSKSIPYSSVGDACSKQPTNQDGTKKKECIWNNDINDNSMWWNEHKWNSNDKINKVKWNYHSEMAYDDRLNPSDEFPNIFRSKNENSKLTNGYIDDTFIEKYKEQRETEVSQLETIITNIYKEKLKEEQDKIIKWAKEQNLSVSKDISSNKVIDISINKVNDISSNKVIDTSINKLDISSNKPASKEPQGVTCPSLKCIADFGTNIGENLCCGQTGVLQNTNYVCPSVRPKCVNYKCGSKFGTCV